MSGHFAFCSQQKAVSPVFANRQEARNSLFKAEGFLFSMFMLYNIFVHN